MAIIRGMLRWIQRKGGSISERRDSWAERVIGMRIVFGFLRSYFLISKVSLRMRDFRCRIRVFCNILMFTPGICQKMQANDDELWNPAHEIDNKWLAGFMKAWGVKVIWDWLIASGVVSWL